jgi:hypothetical protein
MRQIHHFIASHGDWISRKQASVLDRPQPKVKEFVEGEEFLFLGNPCRLCLIDSPSPDVDFDGRLCLSKHALPRAREAIVEWYKKMAGEIFAERVNKYAAVTGCQPAAIWITSPERRWGSCGVSGRVNFNWRLVLAPREVIDYVVVHELAHLKHKGHDSDFWDFVGAFALDYRRQRLWLKNNGHRLRV